MWMHNDDDDNDVHVLEKASILDDAISDKAVAIAMEDGRCVIIVNLGAKVISLCALL
jgi:hypothetical protein